VSDVIFVAVIVLFFIGAVLLVRACGHIVAGSIDTVSRLTAHEVEPAPPT
jgi:hypothetical protein